MARGTINKVMLIGTLGRDPESKSLPDGRLVVNMNVATDEGYVDRNTSQRVDRTEWHRIVAFGRVAEIAQKWLTKGSKVYIEGRLRTRDWEKDGVRHYMTEIMLNELSMLGGGADRQAGTEQHVADELPSAASVTQNRSEPQNTSKQFEDFDDDMPF